MSTMTDAEYAVMLIEPHEKQKLFMRSPAKRKVVKAGRRGGKTTGAGTLAVEKFLAGRRVLYAVPTIDQVERFWTVVCNALAEPIRAGVLRKNETMHTIEVPGTEQRIKAKTAWNADTLRGDYTDFLILDEFQLMNEDSWSVVGAPMLLDNNGDAVFIYTPPSIRSSGLSKARDPRHASKMYKRALADTTGRWAAFHFTSHDNPFLSRVALSEITLDMTALAIKQEIMAEEVDKVPGALWDFGLLDKVRVQTHPELSRIVVGVDPSGGVAEIGIVVGALGKDGHGYVLADHSLVGSPNQWGSAVVNAYMSWDADRIVAEKNFGGEMVEHTLRSVEGGKNVPIKLVSASRGKIVRAEPIAALYERGLIHHVGTFAQLEEEMATYAPGSESPNRMDALVWVLTELNAKSNIWLLSNKAA